MLLSLDRQLRAVLIDPQFGQMGDAPLLGDENDGTFALGYVQVTRMPVAVRPKAPLANATTQGHGRNLGFHKDNPPYGDVIITVTLFGSVEVLLTEASDVDSSLLAMSRQVAIRAGQAYAIWSKGHHPPRTQPTVPPRPRRVTPCVGSCASSHEYPPPHPPAARWKQKHNVILPPTCLAVDPPLDNDIARVGLTFRYFRRSSLEHWRQQQQQPQQTPTCASVATPGTIVDAPFYDHNGRLCTAHLYTYPAVVLNSDGPAGFIRLYYLSDGLTADTDEEAFKESGDVPAREVLPASSAVKYWLCHPECPWTIRSVQRIQQLKETGFSVTV